jgi:glucokinase
MKTFLGIEIGGTKLQIVAGDDSARISHRHRFAVNKKEGAAGIRREIEKVLKQLVPQTKPAAIGVGFGGPVDWQTGQICCSHHVEGWSEFPLGDWLQSIAKVPVRVDNDANVAALGEALHGAGRDLNPVFYVTLGSGVGGGLVVDGKIFHGAKPGESEIGHMRLDKAGRIVESSCSGWAVDQKVREAINKNPDSVFAKLVGSQVGGEAKYLAIGLEQKYPVAQRILKNTAEDLAFALSHVTHLFHPQVIVLGGGLSLLGEPLRVAVESALPPFLMKAFGTGPRIALSSLGEEVVPAGALQLARLAVLQR